ITFYKIREQAPPDSLGGRATLLLLSRVLVDSFRGIKSKLIMKRIFAISSSLFFSSWHLRPLVRRKPPASPHCLTFPASTFPRWINPSIPASTFTVTLVEAGKRRIPFPPIRLRGALTPRGVGN